MGVTPRSESRNAGLCAPPEGAGAAEGEACRVAASPGPPAAGRGSVLLKPTTHMPKTTARRVTVTETFWGFSARFSDTVRLVFQTGTLVTVSNARASCHPPWELARRILSTFHLHCGFDPFPSHHLHCICLAGQAFGSSLPCVSQISVFPWHTQRYAGELSEHVGAPTRD